MAVHGQSSFEARKSAHLRMTIPPQGKRNYTAAVVTPPSITMVWPVMKVEASEAR